MTAALAVPASVLQSHAQGDLQNTILKTHNDERKAVGVDPLTWSDSIAASAQNWANHLQPLGKQVHSTGTGYGSTWQLEEVRHTPLWTSCRGLGSGKESVCTGHTWQ